MRNLVKYTIAGLAMAGAAMLATGPAHAAQNTISAEVDITIAVSVDAVAALDFGSISAPTNVSAVWVLTPNGIGGTLTDTSVSNSVSFAGDSEGQFTINGQNGFNVTFSLGTITDFSDLNLALSAVTTSPGVGTVGLTTGTLDVFIGGTLTILTSATTGSFSDASIVLIADY